MRASANPTEIIQPRFKQTVSWLELIRAPTTQLTKSLDKTHDKTTDHSRSHSTTQARSWPGGAKKPVNGCAGSEWVGERERSKGRETLQSCGS